MIVKEISTQNKECYIIRDLKEDYNNKAYEFDKLFATYEKFEEWILDYYVINKANGFLDYEILEN